jgi:phage baseplate assembly protein V
MNRHYSQLIRATLDQVDDSGPQQLVKVRGLSGQEIGEAVRSQHFGLTSNPPAGAEALMLAIGGGHDRMHALGLEHPQKRPTNLESGGTILYDANGNVLKLIAAGATLHSPSSVTIDAPTVTVKCMTFTVNGLAITVNGQTIALDGTVTLGGPAGSGVPAAKEGTVDTGGFADVTNLAAKVSVV